MAFTSLSPPSSFIKQLQNPLHRPEHLELGAGLQNQCNPNAQQDHGNDSCPEYTSGDIARTLPTRQRIIDHGDDTGNEDLSQNGEHDTRYKLRLAALWFPRRRN